MFSKTKIYKEKILFFILHVLLIKKKKIYIYIYIYLVVFFR